MNTRSEMTGKHPLEHSELFYDINQHQIKLGMSQNVFGLALPLSLQAERSMAAKVRVFSFSSDTFRSVCTL